jgi:hypothetical protein
METHQDGVREDGTLALDGEEDIVGKRDRLLREVAHDVVP